MEIRAYSWSTNGDSCVFMEIRVYSWCLACIHGGLCAFGLGRDSPYLPPKYYAARDCPSSFSPAPSCRTDIGALLSRPLVSSTACSSTLPFVGDSALLFLLYDLVGECSARCTPFCGGTNVCRGHRGTCTASVIAILLPTFIAVLVCFFIIRVLLFLYTYCLLRRCPPLGRCLPVLRGVPGLLRGGHPCIARAPFPLSASGPSL